MPEMHNLWHKLFEFYIFPLFVPSCVFVIVVLYLSKGGK